MTTGVVQNFIKQRKRIKHKSRRVLMSLHQTRRHIPNLQVKVRYRLSLQLHDRRTLIRVHRQRTPMHSRYIQKQEVAGTGLVEVFDEGGVGRYNEGVDAGVARAVAGVDIVYAEEGGKKRVRGVPGMTFVSVLWEEAVFDLNSH